MKAIVKKGLRCLGIEVRRAARTATDTLAVRRDSLEGLLNQVQKLGFSPATVIDVGAASGTFSNQCHQVFPAATYLLIEPLQEFLSPLKRLLKTIPQAHCEHAAASSYEGSMRLNVHHDLVGSSLYNEVEEGTDINGTPREVRTVTIDGMVARRQARPPYLIKIDVQGAELDVLRGAENALKHTEYILLEVSLFQFFKNGPSFSDVVAYMKDKGFVPYDLYELQYRPLDCALAQVDIAFVREAGDFRKTHAYATPEQRAEQNRRFLSYLRRLCQG
jgi:FkbM family methyltransferase